MANLYMEFFKDLDLGSALVKPQLWKWYVDDTCCIVKRGVGEGELSPIPGHFVEEKRGWHPRHLCLSEADAH